MAGCFSGHYDFERKKTGDTTSENAITSHLGEIKKDANGIVGSINLISLVPGQADEILSNIESTLAKMQRIVRVAREINDAAIRNEQ